VFGDDAQGGAQHDPESGLTNVELAAIHEYGAPNANIPERSFIRATVRAKRPELIAFIKPRVKAIYQNKLTLEQALNQLGLFASTEMKKFVTTGDPIPPPLSPAYAARKAAKGTSNGPVRTLIDTGRMIGALTWQVVLGGTKRKGSK